MFAGSKHRDIREYRPEGNLAYTTVYIEDSPTNCKMSSWDNIGYMLDASEDDEQKVKWVKEALEKSKGLVYVNVNKLKHKEFFLKYFDIYGCLDIPIGYGGEDQHHIFIRNATTKLQGAANARPSKWNNPYATVKESAGLKQESKM